MGRCKVLPLSRFRFVRLETKSPFMEPRAERIDVSNRVAGLPPHSQFGPAAQIAVNHPLMMFFTLAYVCSWLVFLPMILFRMGQQGAEESPSFGNWMHGQLDTASGPVDARDAAVAILLIPIAVAVGMTALGLIEFLTAEGFLR